MAEILAQEEAIFHAALEVPADQHAAYLDAACGDDHELRRRVEALLRRSAEASGPLDRPAVNLEASAPLPGVEQPGMSIGPYKLLEQIGEGGMGLVFMAEQLEPVKRKVALKVLKPGMDTRQVVARFEAERKALALMDHPYIAKIFDAGTTSENREQRTEDRGQKAEDRNQPRDASLSSVLCPLSSGRPYFVMELVKGVPITDFCDERRLTMRQRLDLFVSVCQAVQHAHQKGIIHRDLKPTNVLVTLHDAVAVPKVIDFGISKAVGQQLTERTLFTHFAQLVGTPLYMSPEQAEMNSLDVDTRSDVYSLGVLLYELLTGTTPFENETLKKVGLDEMRRMIREEEPPRPSHRVSTLAAEASSTVSERRGVDGRRLHQVLRGELDWIVMKALEKDRNRRYESVSAFAADVQRYLNDEAVEACPPSKVYRLRKFARRYRRALATAAVIALVLVAATAVSAWQAVVARDAQRQAELDRDAARSSRSQAESAKLQAASEAAVASAITQFLQEDILNQTGTQAQVAQRYVSEPDLTVKEALDRAAGKIGGRFRDQPLVEAAIRRAIGNSYLGVGESSLGLSHLKRSLELYQTNLGPNDLRVLQSMDWLAQALCTTAKHRQAVSLYEQTLAARKTILGPDHPDTLRSFQNIARVYVSVGRLHEAIAMHEKLVEIRTSTLGRDHPKTLDLMHHLAHLWYLDGQSGRALKIHELVLERRMATRGAHHDEVIGSVNLARIYASLGRFPESIALYEKILKRQEATIGRDHPNTFDTRYFFGLACHQAGQLDRAERIWSDLLEIQRTRKYPLDSASKANTLVRLSWNLLKQKRYAEAETLAREGLSIFEATRPDDWPTFDAMSVLGGVLLAQKRYAKAEPLLLQGYEGMNERLDTLFVPYRHRLTEAIEYIVNLYEATDRPEQARAWRAKLSAITQSGT